MTATGAVEQPVLDDLTDIDLAGVGIGPFNLSVAALADRVEGLSSVFFDATPSFSWHPGLLLDGTTLQVPFLADLVTLADPTSPHSFLEYLRTRDRLLRFYFREELFLHRREYDAYCRWVAEALPSCRFGHRVTDVRPDGGRWRLTVERAGRADGSTARGQVTARSVVLGVGTAPWVPPFAAGHLGAEVLHTASWTTHRERALAAGSVTVIGSGQSAAEVVLDVLGAEGAPSLDWFTSDRGFFPMEYTKLGLEHFSLEYHRWFHGLAEERRDALRAGQDLLYKGISPSTSAAIFDRLYERTVDGGAAGLDYLAGVELVGMERLDGGGWRLTLLHHDEGVTIEHDTDVVVLGTGYRPRPLPIEEALLSLDGSGRPVVEADQRLRLADGSASSLFLLGTELHSHGVGAPDLGLGALRAARIVNAAAGHDHYRVPERTVFQTFGTHGWIDRKRHDG